MFCKSCGNQLPNDAPFCGNCGAPVSVSDRPKPIKRPNPAAAGRAPDSFDDSTAYQDEEPLISNYAPQNYNNEMYDSASSGRSHSRHASQKKSKVPLIAALALIVVAGVVFAFFGLFKNDDVKAEKLDKNAPAKTTTTTAAAVADPNAAAGTPAAAGAEMAVETTAAADAAPQPVVVTEANAAEAAENKPAGEKKTFTIDYEAIDAAVANFSGDLNADNAAIKKILNVNLEPTYEDHSDIGVTTYTYTFSEPTYTSDSDLPIKNIYVARAYNWEGETVNNNSVNLMTFSIELDITSDSFTSPMGNTTIIAEDHFDPTIINMTYCKYFYSKRH